ncbi:MAG: dihydropyrimidine dehydrogenase, partial [Acidimicrobiia bacterium]
MTRDEALSEAHRCLMCWDAPCIRACPTSIDVPEFIKRIASDDLIGSARTILESNILGGSCARVCPTEVLCEGA